MFIKIIHLHNGKKVEKKPGCLDQFSKYNREIVLLYIQLSIENKHTIYPSQFNKNSVESLLSI